MLHYLAPCTSLRASITHCKACMSWAEQLNIVHVSTKKVFLLFWVVAATCFFPFFILCCKNQCLLELLWESFGFSTPRMRGVGVDLQHQLYFEYWAFVHLCRRASLFASILWCSVQFLSLLLVWISLYTLALIGKMVKEGCWIGGLFRHPYAYMLIVRDPVGEEKKIFQSRGCSAKLHMLYCAIEVI